jgi:nicotinic acid mononucleotide adenylyltransferase
MNSLVKSLIFPLLESEQKGVALIPGGFKPPTIGHFVLVDEVAQNPNFDKVIVLIGHKVRDGVTKEESLAIWDIYKKYLPSNVEIKISDNSSPISDVSSFIKNNPDTYFYPIVGIRGEMDLGDIKRFDSLEGKYPNFKTVVIRSEEGENRVSGTNTRAALIGGKKEIFQQYLPSQLTDEEKDSVWSILTKTPIEEGTCGYTTDATTGEELDTPGGIEEIYAEPSKFDYPKLLKSLTEFMLDKGMNIKPLPKVKFIEDDVENARDFFGKTAYYNPNQRVIVLYTMDRHPKDIMRSFAHEMIHHMQNCDDRLNHTPTTNINKDNYLYELEKEANTKGTMTFREWTDTLTEGVFEDRIKCDNCGWSWKVKDGGKDLYVCHKCGTNNTPKQLNEETEEDNGTLSYESIFKPDINILVAFKNYENYKILKPLFNKYGYGFYSPEDKTIILNGERFINSDLDFRDFKFVEAHEITHLLLGHTGPYSEEDEMDADLGAYILLKNKKLSTDRLVNEFENRHGVPFTEELLERVKNRL